MESGSVFFLESRKGGELGVFFWSKNRRDVCVFLEQKICSGSFICSRNFIQPIFPAIRETDLCSDSKREFFFRTVFG